MTPCFPWLPVSPFWPCSKIESTGPLPCAEGEINQPSVSNYPLPGSQLNIIPLDASLYMHPGLIPGSPFCPLTPFRPGLPGIPACPGWPLQFTSHWPLARSKVRPTRVARPLRLPMVPLTGLKQSLTFQQSRHRNPSAKVTCGSHMGVFALCRTRLFVEQCLEPGFCTGGIICCGDECFFLLFF